MDGAEPLIAELDAADLSPEERHELLMTAARRLTATDDPTALSYVLTALVQVDLSARQELLETPDTLSRLRRLERLLERESWHLSRSLRPIVLDPAFAFAPVLKDSLYAVWLVPAVLAPYIIRKPGAAVFAELVAAGVSALLGSAWGADTLLSGLLQGGADGRGVAGRATADNG